jgi:peptidoglycan/xylan/chitin deacetylase (PgdA/CDA1 family)
LEICLLRVLTYHRIVERDDDPETTPGIASATVERFEAHVQFFARHCDPVGLGDVLRAARGEARLPRRAVLVTFDDAYRDFADSAWPILKRHGVPAALFVPTAYVGYTGPVFWWDRLYRSLLESGRDSLHVPLVGTLTLRNHVEKNAAFARIRNRMKGLMHDDAMMLVDGVCDALGRPTAHFDSSVLCWDTLRALASEGVSLASHTHTHPLLNRVPRERVQEEIRQSIRALERELDMVEPALSYPNGAHDDTTLDALRRAGIELAFTQLPGHNDLPSCDPLRLCRINVTRRTSLPLLRLRLQRWFVPIERWRKRKRIRTYLAPPSEAPGAAAWRGA